jgi:hypothetical protein
MGQTELLEKAKSRSQQRLMGMALAYKRGEMKDASASVKRMADSMSEKDLEDYAKTKHDKIPEKIDEEMSVDQRRKTARRMKRMKAKLRIGRRKHKNKMPDAKRLNRRARRSARGDMFQQLSKGKKDLSYAQRKNISKRLDRMKGRVDRLHRKMKPVKRREAARR